MAVTVKRAGEESAHITFTLPQQTEPGAVSVVGSFNDWKPGAHEMQVADTGALSVVVEVPYGQEVHFRYLADGGRWFDDPDVETESEADVGRVVAVESGVQGDASSEPSTDQDTDQVDLDARIVDLNSGHISRGADSVSPARWTGQAKPATTP